MASIWKIAVMLFLLTASAACLNQEAQVEQIHKEAGIGTPAVTVDELKENPKKYENNYVSLKGVITDVKQTPVYTIIEVDDSTGKVWANLPRTDAPVGVEINIEKAMVGLNVSSRTLNRTFDILLFTPGVASIHKEDVVGEPAEISDVLQDPSLVDTYVKVTGNVTAIENTEHYSYVQIDDGTGKVWGVLPRSNFTMGQRIIIYQGLVASGFHSMDLNKTFETLLMAPGALPQK